MKMMSNVPLSVVRAAGRRPRTTFPPAASEVRARLWRIAWIAEDIEDGLADEPRSRPQADASRLGERDAAGSSTGNPDTFAWHQRAGVAVGEGVEVTGRALTLTSIEFSKRDTPSLRVREIVYVPACAGVNQLAEPRPVSSIVPWLSFTFHFGFRSCGFG